MADPKAPDGTQPPTPPAPPPPAPPASPTPPAAAPPAPIPLAGVRAMNPEEIRQAEAAEQARILAEVQERNATDEHVGGRYKVGDEFVDAEGKPIKAKKD